MDVGQLAQGLATSPLAWMLALSLLAVAYLFRELSIERKERLQDTKACEAEHRETFMKLIPITEKMNMLIERLLSKGGL